MVVNFLQVTDIWKNKRCLSAVAALANVAAASAAPVEFNLNVPSPQTVTGCKDGDASGFASSDFVRLRPATGTLKILLFPDCPTQINLPAAPDLPAPPEAKKFAEFVSVPVDA